MVTALHNFLIKAMGFCFKPLWNLQNSTHKINKTNKNERWKKKKKPFASSSSVELDEVVGGHIQKRIQVDASKSELLERPFFWGLPSHHHINFHIRLKPKTPLIKNKHRLTYRDRDKEEEETVTAFYIFWIFGHFENLGILFWDFPFSGGTPSRFCLFSLWAK